MSGPTQQEILRKIEQALQAQNARGAKEEATHWLNQQNTPSLRWGLLVQRSRAHEALKDIDAAIADLEAALSLDGRYARLWNDLGILWVDKKNLQRASDAFTRAVMVDAQYVRAWGNLGLMMRDLGDLDKARQALRKAVSIDHKYVLGWINLASVERDAGDDAAAEHAAKQALALDPDKAPPLMLLAAIYQRAGRLAEAETHVHRILQLQPANDRAYALLGDIKAECGHLDEARQAYRQAHRLRPSNLRTWIREQLVLPMVPAGLAAVQEARGCYEAGLAVLAQKGRERARGLTAEVLFSELKNVNFLLAYQGNDDRVDQQRYAKFLADCIDTVAPEWRAPIDKRAASGKIRVGFLSSFLREGTVGRYFEHWLTDLDERFEVFFYHLYPQQDTLVGRLRARADHFHDLSRSSLPQVATQVRQDQLDVLLYPELGMDTACFVLAALRLAPLQGAAWGHPVTTGHETIDVFFSCAEMEPADAAQYYSERLLLLPGLGTCYADPAVDQQDFRGRQALGLPEDKVLLLCPQSLFKIHPDNDRLFAQILSQTSDAQLVFFDGRDPAWQTQISARLQKVFTELAVSFEERVHFLPSGGHPRYLAINRACDLMLDTMHWSGGNTSLDALASGLPVVTLPGRFMRGRQSMAMLNMIDVPELIAQSPEDYVARAVALAQDKVARRALSEKILRNKHRLFNDQSAIAVLQEFFVAECA